VLNAGRMEELSIFCTQTLKFHLHHGKFFMVASVGSKAVGRDANSSME